MRREHVDLRAFCDTGLKADVNEIGRLSVAGLRGWIRALINTGLQPGEYAAGVA
jgi:hypothetical protein